MKTVYFFPIAIATTLLFNCKGDIGVPGPVGPAPLITEQSFLAKEGFIRAKLTTMVGSVSTIFDFDFQGNLSGAPSTYMILDSNKTRVEINKFAYEVNVYKDGHLQLYFDVDNLSNLANARMGYLYVFALKQTTPMTLIEVKMNSVSSSTLDSVKISDLKYDASTNIISGKFTGTVADVNDTVTTKTSRPITDGSFSAFLMQKLKAVRKSN